MNAAATASLLSLVNTNSATLEQALRYQRRFPISSRRNGTPGTPSRITHLINVLAGQTALLEGLTECEGLRAVLEFVDEVRGVNRGL